MGQDPTTVTMRERVTVVKVDKDNPEKEPEIIVQETVSQISVDEAMLMGFMSNNDGPPPPVEGVKVGDQ